MTTAKTTIKYKGVEYPFYRTIRGQWDFENAGFTNADMVAGKISAMYAYIYFQLRDCARRAGFAWNTELGNFIDNADGEELLEVYGRLLQAEKKNQKEGEKEPGKPGTKSIPQREEMREFS